MPGKQGQRKKRGPNKSRQEAWQSMRVFPTFTIPDILATASINLDNLRRFILRLEAAGYIRRVREKMNGHAGSYNVYRLVRNSGPKVPVLWNDGGVYDPNLDQLFGAPTQKEAVHE